MHEDYQEEAQGLQQSLTEKYKQRDKLNEEVKTLNTNITNMNTARNYLYESISDLEKVISDLELEQRRLTTKQKAVLTQIMDSEISLNEKNLLNEQQAQKLEKLKQKVNRSHQ